MVFSIPSFIGVGDDFDAHPKTTDERAQGLNFAVPVPKKGKLNDATFRHATHSIHEGDPFVETNVAERRDAKEKREKWITSNGFRYSNPPKKNSGLGNFYGTFDAAPIPHHTEYVVPQKGEAPPKKENKLRGIFACPTGGSTSLLQTTSEHIADFNDPEKDIGRKRELEFRRTMKELNRPAWKGASRRGMTFDEGLGTGVSKCYTMTKPMAPPRKSTEGNDGGKNKVDKRDIVPWRPNGVGKSKLPPLEYREDPYGGVDPRVRKQKKIDDNPRGSWRPGGRTDDFWYTSTIAFKGL